MESNEQAHWRGGAGWCLALVLLATVLGAAIRLHDLGGPSFWHDELMTVRDVANPARKSFMRRGGYLPTAIGLRMHGVDVNAIDDARPDQWRAMGVTETATRTGACIIGMASVLILGVSLRLIASWRACAAMALLLALGSWHVYWSQTARFYGSVLLLAGLSLIFYFDATRAGESRVWRGWPRAASLTLAVVWLALAFWSHWSALLIAPVFVVDYGVAWWVRQRVELRVYGWVLLLSCAVAAGAFLIYAASTHAFDMLGMVGHSPFKLAAGTAYMVGLPVVVMAIIGAALLWREDRRLAAYLSLAAIMPVLCLSILALLDQYAHVRYAYVSSFGIVALAAAGAARLFDMLRRHTNAIIAWSPLWLLLAYAIYTDVVYFTSGGGYHPRWRDAFAVVQSQRQSADRVYCGEPEGYVAAYYLQSPNVEPRMVEREDLATLQQRAWIVVVTETATFGRVHHWLHDAAKLEATFPLHLHQPYAQVSVYEYVPGETAEKSQ